MGTFLIAIVVSWLTAQFALRRFYRERWWEKKYEAYASIIDALHHMSAAFDQEGKDRPIFLSADGGLERDPKKEMIKDKYRQGKAEILRITDVGEFVISQAAVRELRSLLTRLPDDPENYTDQVSESGNAVERSLTRVRELAQDDLNPTILDRLRRYWRGTD